MNICKSPQFTRWYQDRGSNNSEVEYFLRQMPQKESVSTALDARLLQYNHDKDPHTPCPRRSTKHNHGYSYHSLWDVYTQQQSPLLVS